MDLFSHSSDENLSPLADRIRPQKFEDMVGQSQIFKNNKNLLELLKAGHLQSLILWGPPGCGKTSFAKAIMSEVSANYYEENAIDLGVKKIRELGESAKRKLFEQQEKSILFVDEIHRLNRGQQDVLLPYVEKGYFYLIGATTENPSYQLNAALVSRCRLLIFQPLEENSLKQLFEKALQLEKLEETQVFTSESVDHVMSVCHGDGRRLLNLLEEIIFFYRKLGGENFPLTIEKLNELFHSSGIRFDKKGDEHYDTISAFIKSIRGSDPDAGVYYLARMLAGGEDPLFIARRLVILASEDVGNADPNALTVAVSCLQAVELVGLPEAEINLSQAVTYLASAPKSNRSYQAIKKAKSVVAQTGPLPVPKSLRSSQTKLMKEIGHGKDYKYSHDGDRGWIDQDFFPEELKDRHFYEPAERGFEKRIKDYLAWVKKGD